MNILLVADEKNTGTGLGLPIVKSIVESHGGVIEITSIYGKCIEVNISLPIII